MPNVYLMYTSHDQYLVSVDITTLRLSLKTLRAAVPTPWGTRDQFNRRQFFHIRGGGGGFSMIPIRSRQPSSCMRCSQ